MDTSITTITIETIIITKDNKTQELSKQIVMKMRLVN